MKWTGAFWGAPRLKRWRPPRLARGADRALCASIVAAVAGAALGTILASDRTAEAAPWLRAWITSQSGARNALATMLGLQITLVTIALATTTLVYQSLASQYSPRLLGLISPVAPLYREIPLFVLSSAYILAGVRKLGLSAASGVEPRPVVLGGLLLLIVALTSVLASVVRTFRRLQVEEILHRTREETLAAVRRLAHACRSLPAAESSLAASPASTPLIAPKNGYVIGVDLALLDHLARRFGLMVRIERPVGQFVARGETLGWFEAAEGVRRDLVAKTLASGVLVDRRRSSYLDVGLGLRVLADIADRALSPAVNDPTTARQSLHQMRVLLRELVEMQLEDATLVDDLGKTLVSIALPRFQDYLATALHGPCHYGAGDADVVAEILDVAQEIGRAVDYPDRRAAIRMIAVQAVADATHRGEIDPARLAVLQDKGRAVALVLEA